VLALLREGLTNEEIAHRLAISFYTAKFHVSEILSKLRVSTREEAVEVLSLRERRWLGLLFLPFAGGLFHVKPVKTASLVLAYAVAAGILAVISIQAWPSLYRNGAAQSSRETSQSLDALSDFGTANSPPNSSDLTAADIRERVQRLQRDNPEHTIGSRCGEFQTKTITLSVDKAAIAEGRSGGSVEESIGNCRIFLQVTPNPASKSLDIIAPCQFIMTIAPAGERAGGSWVGNCDGVGLFTSGTWPQPVR
jgi:hypothetical protein